MSDIHNCIKCDDEFYMDNGTHCSVCGDWFCPCCDIENTKMLKSTEGDYYHICKDCLNEGLDYINQDHMDDATFTQEEFDKLITKK